jgi:PBP1b-binding outer membrane lipoprotein LpoB
VNSTKYIFIILLLSGCVSLSYHQKKVKEASENTATIVEPDIDKRVIECHCGNSHLVSW